MINFFKNIKNAVTNQYAGHQDAVIIACYYNPTNSPIRLEVFNKWYETIRHLNHRIIECVVGTADKQLPDSEFITTISTSSNLWHKEQLLNKIIRELPQKFKYVFWLDTDILFTNRKWMTEAVERLQRNKVVQLFDYCVHLEKGEMSPSFDVNDMKRRIDIADEKERKVDGRRMWKGYASVYVNSFKKRHTSQNYDVRGHVGFAWGARREVLEKCPLYDRALIGGADSIIAYASTNQLKKLKVVTDMFGNIIDDVYSWGGKWFGNVLSNIGYVSGDIYHLWHGDLNKRQYYKRAIEFGPTLRKIHAENKTDKNGLYSTDNTQATKYIDNYYVQRETSNFTESVVLLLNDGLTGGLIGGNMIGGMVGDALNTSEDRPSDSSSDSHDHQASSHDHPTTQPSYDQNDSNQNVS